MFSSKVLTLVNSEWHLSLSETGACIVEVLAVITIWSLVLILGQCMKQYTLKINETKKILNNPDNTKIRYFV